ncbi:putative protein NDR1 [Helianthus annuus]|nr:putative protein NDR1 [Helianthus annuus]
MADTIKSCTVITTNTIIFLIFLWLYLTRVFPSIDVEEFYVPALNCTGNFTSINNTIYIDLKLKNRNLVTGLYYIDPLYLNLSFISKEQNTTIHLAELGLHGFYQGNGKTKQVKGLLMTRGLPSVWNETKNETQGHPSGAFRVDIFGKVRHKLVGVKKMHPMLLGANVEVDDKTGVKVGNKPITLMNSGAWDKKGAMFLSVLMMYGVFLF